MEPKLYLFIDKLINDQFLDEVALNCQTMKIHVAALPNAYTPVSRLNRDWSTI